MPPLTLKCNALSLPANNFFADEKQVGSLPDSDKTAATASSFTAAMMRDDLNEKDG